VAWDDAGAVLEAGSGLMPHPFPHHYEVALEWTKDGDKSQITAGERAPIAGGSPPEFDGTDLSRWSPEHLILAALSQCLFLTWVSLNKRSAIPLLSWKGSGASTLDKTREGLVFSELKVGVKMSVPAERIEEARKLLDTAKKYCIIANSLKTPTTLEAEVVAG
jgi:organic hydroperoxide reductase OsmC/OhrA